MRPLQDTNRRVVGFTIQTATGPVRSTHEVSGSEYPYLLARTLLESTPNVVVPYEGFDRSGSSALKFGLISRESIVGSTWPAIAYIDVQFAPDGETIVMPDFTLIGRTHSTFDEVEALVAEGLVHGRPREFVAQYVGGSGGDGALFDFLTWLLEHGVDLGAGAYANAYWEAVLRPTLGAIRSSLWDREARRTAILWASRGIGYPQVLRRFVDRREAWEPDILARRLTVHPVVARQLLRQLGYAKNAKGVWVVATSKKAKSRRRRWLEDETEGYFQDDLST